MDECIEVLENSPDALPSDRRIIHWTKLARIIEEISSRFFADDLGGPSFSESKFQFTLKAFEKQLAHWKDEVSKTNESGKQYFPPYVLFTNESSYINPGASHCQHLSS